MAFSPDWSAAPWPPHDGGDLVLGVAGGFQPLDHLPHPRVIARVHSSSSPGPELPLRQVQGVDALLAVGRFPGQVPLQLPQILLPAQVSYFICPKGLGELADVGQESRVVEVVVGELRLGRLPVHDPLVLADVDGAGAPGLFLARAHIPSAVQPVGRLLAELVRQDQPLVLPGLI